MQRDLQPEKPFEGPLPGIPGTMVREVEALPEHLEGGEAIAPCTEVAANALYFEVPGIARYLVRDGKTVDVAVSPNADRAAARLFLVGSARGALIHQRGELPLNAATLVAPNWKSVAICGPSTIGKSTLAAALCRRGWLLVADDLTRVTWNGTMAIAWPSSDRINLWRDACEMLGENADGLARVRDGMERFFLPARSAATPTALYAAVRLGAVPYRDNVEISLEDRTKLLSESTFRWRWLLALGGRAEHARAVGQIARRCRGVLLGGARERPAEELADRVEEVVR
jgi:hypothetical protein